MAESNAKSGDMAESIAPRVHAVNDGLRVEYVPLADLVPAPANPKRHDVAALRESLDRFGYVAPVLVDEATGRLVAGHGRLEALRAAMEAGEAPPARVEVGPDGSWRVPAIRGVAFASPADAEAYLLADNQLTTKGGWDEPELAVMLQRLMGEAEGVVGTGFDMAEAERITRRALAAAGAEDPGPQVDRAAELQAKWGTARGQLWTVGRHRVLCGDATCAEDVARLMGEELADAVITDPPYGMNLDTDWSDLVGSLGPIGRARGTRGNKYEAVTGDDVSFDPTAIFSAFGYCREIFLFGADYYAELIPDRVRGSWLVWDKRKDTQAEAIGSEFELCWSKAKHKRRMLRHDWFGFLSSGNQSEARDRVHPTQKPTSLMRDIAEQWTPEGCLIADPYLGSGTVVVAAEQIGRRCYGLEIEPKYVAVILERLAGMGLTSVVQ